MYYLVIVQNNSVSAVYAYNTYDEAVKAHHSEQAYFGLDRNSTLTVILDENGNTMLKEKWMRQITE